MLDVLIDSCIYRADRKRNKAAFRVIARLGRAGKLRVHVPTYVKNEVISKQQDDIGKNINELKSAAESILRTTGAAALTTFADDIVASVTAAQAHAKQDLATEFQGWLQEVHAAEAPIQPDHGQRVTEAYFAGSPPFRSQKHRADFPDSFIWEAAVDIARQCGWLPVVSTDARFREAADAREDMEGFATLDDFVEDGAVQDALEELIPEAIATNIKRATAFLPQEKDNLIGYLENDVVGELAGKHVRHESIPDENNEGTITSVGSPENVEFDFKTPSTMGTETLGFRLPRPLTAN